MTARVVNVTLAALLLFLTAPLLLVVSFFLWWESSGPILEKRVSIGRQGQRVALLNFRTTGHQLGSFLRYTRIESLPELVNVLRGDIDLVDIEFPAGFWLVLVACAATS
jgi:lipopolysaccharide/colanic/teichoic acid biosynthesis glycosyltransferase